MPVTRGGAGSSSFGGAGGAPRDSVDTVIVNTISADVSRAILEVILELFGRIQDHVIAMMVERMTVVVIADTEDLRQRIAAVEARGGDQPRVRTVTYRDFSVCQPSIFEGLRDLLVSQRKVVEVEGAFRTSFCPDEFGDRFVVSSEGLVGAYLTTLDRGGRDHHVLG